MTERSSHQVDLGIVRSIRRASMRQHALGMTVAALILTVTAAPSLAQSPAPATFTSASLIDTGFEGLVHGGEVSAIAGGDFNNDGKPDLIAVATCTGCGNFGVFLGNGNGTFSGTTYPLNGSANGNNPNLLAVGDFNGDGNLDFAVYINGSNQTNFLDVYLGDGTGHFNYSNDYQVGATGSGGPYQDGVVTADVNGDGKLDLMAINSGDNTVTVLLGNGDGTFQTGVQYTATCTGSGGCFPYALTVGDFNSDGHPDLAIVGSNNGTGVYILLNNGNGTFQSPVFYLGSNSYGAGFSDGESGVAAADFNGDGKLDLAMIYDYGVAILLGNGDGTFQTGVTYGVSNPDGVAVADVNKDNKLDLVVAGGFYTSTVSVLLGNGNGTFKPAVGYATDSFPQSIVLADYNQDGHLDFAVGSDSGPNITLASGNGDGTFRTGPNYNLNNWTGQVEADFNNDGNPDVAVFSSGPNSIQVMLGNSHGVLGTPIVTTVSTDTLVWVAAGDVNGDGKPDLIAATDGPNPSGLGVFLGNGNGTFKTPAFYSSGDNAGTAFIALGDFNNDGKLDAVISNTDGSLSVLLNQGAGVFGTATVISGVAAGGEQLATGDFNGDGKLDLAVADTGKVAILLGNGDGTFQAPAYFAVNGYPGFVVVADFNKDGKLDLATGGYGVFGNSSSTNAIAILLGNGDGTLGLPTYFNLYPNGNCGGSGCENFPAGTAAVADVNQDGNLDLLFGFQGTHTWFGNCCESPYNVGLGILLGNGDGTFEFENALGEPGVAGGPFLVGTGSYDVLAADFNSDGAIDAAVLNQYNFGGGSGTAYVTMLLNTTLPVSVSPLTVNFGSRKVNTSTSQTVVLTNNSATSESVSVSLTGTNKSDFSFKSACGTKINGGGQTCSITVTFKPTVGGSLSATLNLTVGGKAYASQLKGAGLALTLSPTSLNFGSVKVGQSSSPMPVTVTNNSSSAISIVSPGITIVGLASKDYSQTNNCGNSIGGGQSCTINVTFTPMKTGVRSASLEINDTDGNTPQKVSLTGTGT